MGRREACAGVWWGNLRGKDHWVDPGVDGRIILKIDLQEVGCWVMDWIGLAQDRERWRVLVNAVMNLRVPLNFGEFLD
jgi:CRISPR/Cas system-associated protein Cas7 (RAMP superfamily)